MTCEQSIRLMLPTDRTIEGPRLRKDDTGLIVEYDCEKDDGSLAWSVVVFHEPLYFEHRDVSCCRADDIIAPNIIRTRMDSDLLRAIIKRWQESVGWQDWQKAKGGPGRFRHYSLFFDNVASIDIVASKCILENI